MTAEEVYREARKVMPKIAVGTVYRVLSELCDAGTLRRIRVADAPDRFDRTLTPHEHIICPLCGRTEDLFVKGLDDCLQSAMEERPFSYELNVHALCSQCRPKKAQDGGICSSCSDQGPKTQPQAGV